MFNLATGVPLDEGWIAANFKEMQLSYMRAGEKSEIHVDSSGRNFRSHVDGVAGATCPLLSLLPPTNSTGSDIAIVQRIPVRIGLEPAENRDHQFRPGINVAPNVYLK